MTAARRALAVLLDPAREWTSIVGESGDPAYLLSRYVALLALVPAVFGFVGASLVGTAVPGAGVVRAPPLDALFGAILGYALSFVTILTLGLIIRLTAPLFGGRGDFDSALKLAVYSYTPVWLAGIFLLLPGLYFLISLGLYGGYVFGRGVPRLMQSPPQKSPGYALLIVVCAGVLTLLAAATQHAVFPTAAI